MNWSIKNVVAPPHIVEISNEGDSTKKIFLHFSSRSRKEIFNGTEKILKRIEKLFSCRVSQVSLPSVCLNDAINSRHNIYLSRLLLYLFSGF